MSARILVVDDDAGLRDLLSATFTFAGYEVLTAGDVATALGTLRGGVDLAVVDVMLPGPDGFDLVRLLRGSQGPGARLPVLLLTARDGVDDRVRGLRLGADDYLVKPFDVVELTARVEALLRRAGPAVAPETPRTLRCADLELDADRHAVHRGGQPVDLSPTEFRLLEFLLENSGRVVSKGQILQHVWQYDFGGDANVVERFVSNLRRKLGDGLEGRPTLLHTVRGFGYRLAEPA